MKPQFLIFAGPERKKKVDHIHHFRKREEGVNNQKGTNLDLAHGGATKKR